MGTGFDGRGTVRLQKTSPTEAINAGRGGLIERAFAMIGIQTASRIEEIQTKRAALQNFYKANSKDIQQLIAAYDKRDHAVRPAAAAEVGGRIIRELERLSGVKYEETDKIFAVGAVHKFMGKVSKALGYPDRAKHIQEKASSYTNSHLEILEKALRVARATVAYHNADSSVIKSRSQIAFLGRYQ